MFNAIFFYELKSWLKKPSIYLYALVFFSIALFMFLGNAGWFDGGETSKGVQRLVNSPFELNYMFNYFNKFFLFLLPAIVGASIYKDYNSDSYQLMYSFPIKKRDYLLGKLVSSMLIVIAIVVSVGIAFIIGEQFPGLNNSKLGPFNPLAYVQLFAVFIIPNMIICGLMVFSVVLWTRNIYYGFGVVIGLFLFQIIVENAFDGQAEWLALSDPLAKNTVAYFTRYWNLLEQNTLSIPIEGMILYNRLLWLSGAVFVFLFAYKRFQFHQELTPLFSRKREKKIVKKEQSGYERKSLSFRPTFQFTWQQKAKNIFYLSQANVRFMLKSPMFYCMLGFGILSILFAVGRITNGGEITILPVTRIMLSIPAFFFKAIIILLTFIYSGMLVQRDRSAKMNQLVDTTAISSGELFLSKLLSISKMQGVLLLCLLFVGIGIQVYNNFYEFEIGLYLFDLFVLSFLSLLVWNLISFFIHTVFSNTYLGIFVLILIWLGSGSLDQLGIETHLLSFNQSIQLNYSDLNGYGNQLTSFFITQSYWLAFGILLLISTFLLWKRGAVDSIRERMALFQRRWRKSFLISATLSLLTIVVLGFKIYEEEQKDLAISNASQNKALAIFKKEFAQYAGMNQPRIKSIKLDLDLFPTDNSFKSEGVYQLRNESNEIIDTFIVRTGFEELSSFTLNRGYQIVQENDYFKSSVVKLTQPLEPGDSIELSFSIQNKENTLFERYSNVLKNGTFMLQDIFPRIGYILDNEEKNPHTRNCRENHASASDSDFIRFEAILSTSSDQTLLAPGHLLKEWTEGERNYFHYRTSAPMKYSLGFNSGRFQSVKEEYKGVGLEVHYYEGHDYNLNTMLSGLKSSLDYNTRHFGAYQHNQARIIEFPQTEGTFATTYANNIPMSEVRFIANNDTSGDKVDLSFYVSAHELTHQWWGSQLVPANAKGARMLSESITEYISLNIYRNHYGGGKAFNFLKNQRERYLIGRTREHKKEPVLSLVGSEQLFLFYGKGSMAFNSLAGYWGEELLNQQLKTFLERYKFKTAPYPTSLGLLHHLKQNYPDSLSYLLHDWFETIVFYENSIEEATVQNKKDGSYELNVKINVKKVEEETGGSLPLSDYIDLGIYYEDGSFEVKRNRVDQEESKHQFYSTKKPIQIRLDPNLLLMEKDIENNEIFL